MSYVAIDDNEIDVGDPVKKELFDKVKDNFDDHETRISAIENGSQKINVFKSVVLNASSASTLTGLAYFKADFAFNLIDATVQIFEKGSLTGTLEIDVKKSTTDLDNSSFATVFTTEPSIDYSTASDYDESTNKVFDAGQVSISSGDILRLDITSLPSGGVIGKFIVNVIGEIS